MNHDITHCSGMGTERKFGEVFTMRCLLRDTCKRYLAYRELTAGQTVSMVRGIECMNAGHEMYWKETSGAIHDQTDAIRKEGEE